MRSRSRRGVSRRQSSRRRGWREERWRREGSRRRGITRPGEKAENSIIVFLTPIGQVVAPPLQGTLSLSSRTLRISGRAPGWGRRKWRGSQE